MNLDEQLLAYENGELDAHETTRMFQQLLDEGMSHGVGKHYIETVNELLRANQIVCHHNYTAVDRSNREWCRNCLEWLPGSDIDLDERSE